MSVPGISKEQFDAIVKVAVHAALEAVLAEQRRLDERIYDLKQIAAECGVDAKTVRRWVKDCGLQIDRDPIGISIRRSDLERWLRSSRPR